MLILYVEAVKRSNNGNFFRFYEDYHTHQRVRNTGRVSHVILSPDAGSSIVVVGYVIV